MAFDGHYVFCRARSVPLEFPDTHRPFDQSVPQGTLGAQGGVESLAAQQSADRNTIPAGPHGSQRDFPDPAETVH